MSAKEGFHGVFVWRWESGWERRDFRFEIFFELCVFSSPLVLEEIEGGGIEFERFAPWGDSVERRLDKEEVVLTLALISEQC